MGLFDKIKDNAKTISMKAIDATREYDDEYSEDQVTQNAELVDIPTNQATSSDDDFNDNSVVTPDETVNEAVEGEIVEPDTKEPDTKPEEVKPEVKTEATIGKAETRKSKVTEVTKEDHEKAEKEKRSAKAKQAAKERLAKSYTPSYKKSSADKAVNEEKVEDEEPSKAKSSSTPKRIGIIDITPGKFKDPTKQAIYARERAALNALASQRKLNGTVPLYTTAHMNFKTRVFVDRVEYSGSFGKNILPVEKIAWVKLRQAGTGVILETTEGKRVVMVVKQVDRLSFADAILKVQALQPKKAKIKDTKTVRIDQLEKFGEGIDEIEKLAKLYDKGILSQEEFDAKKKQILGL